MEKIIAWILSFLMLIFGWLGGNKHNFDYQKETYRTFCKVVKSIENQDKDELKSLFSKNAIKETKDLDEKIDELFAFVKGEIVSFTSEKDNIVPALLEYDNGKEKITTSADYTFVTNEAKYYLEIKQCIKDDFDRDNEGVTYICIINAEDWKEDFSYVPYCENVFGIIID